MFQSTCQAKFARFRSELREPFCDHGQPDTTPIRRILFATSCAYSGGVEGARPPGVQGALKKKGKREGEKKKTKGEKKESGKKRKR